MDRLPGESPPSAVRKTGNGGTHPPHLAHSGTAAAIDSRALYVPDSGSAGDHISADDTCAVWAGVGKGLQYYSCDCSKDPVHCVGGP